VAGLAPELSQQYKELGARGLNSGVLLLHAARARASVAWADQVGNIVDNWSVQLGEAAIKKLVKRFNFLGRVGDQDWLTLVSLAEPALVHTLPCTYNRFRMEFQGPVVPRQTSLLSRGPGPQPAWEAAHSCPGESAILHHNCRTKRFC
jgi:hypothetical protein